MSAACVRERQEGRPSWRLQRQPPRRCAQLTDLPGGAPTEYAARTWPLRQTARLIGLQILGVGRRAPMQATRAHQ